MKFTIREDKQLTFIQLINFTNKCKFNSSSHKLRILKGYISNIGLDISKKEAIENIYDYLLEEYMYTKDEYLNDKDKLSLLKFIVSKIPVRFYDYFNINSLNAKYFSELDKNDISYKIKKIIDPNNYFSTVILSKNSNIFIKHNYDNNYHKLNLEYMIYYNRAKEFEELYLKKRRINSMKGYISKDNLKLITNTAFKLLDKDKINDTILKIVEIYKITSKEVFDLLDVEEEEKNKLILNYIL